MAQIRISDDCRDRLRDFCQTNGVSMSAMLECVVPALEPDVRFDDLHPRIQEWVLCARDVDAERRSRESPS